MRKDDKIIYFISYVYCDKMPSSAKAPMFFVFTTTTS